jgi:hypothetical protein
MSVSLILIPAALAAAAVIGASGTAGILSLSAAEHQGADGRASQPDASGPRPVAVRTRMKDPDLLRDALAALGASEVRVDGRAIDALVDGHEITLSPTPEGVWAAHIARVDGLEVSDAAAADLIERLDAAYAREVQRAVAERIRSRADGAGFELVSETREDDETLTMVLNVRGQA